MSCTTRRHLACGAGAGGTLGDTNRRAAADTSSSLPPIVEERLLDTADDSTKDNDNDDDDVRDATDCCRCCCLRRDLEAPPAWRDLDIQVTPTDMRPFHDLNINLRATD